MDLDSGPIMKASSGAADDHGAAHMGQHIPADSGIGNVMFSVTTEYHTRTKEEFKKIRIHMEKGILIPFD